MRAAALALLLTACMGGVPQRPAAAPETLLEGGMWCVVAETHGEHLVACVESAEFCSQAQREVRRRGRLVGIRSVSACLWVKP